MVDTSEDVLIIESENGRKRFEVLFRFYSPDTKKSYVGYTDNNVKDGRKNIFVSSYTPNTNYQNLEDLEDKKEVEMVSKVLESLDNNING